MGADAKRIDWIDLAKGFCILLVVFHHVAVRLQVDYPLSDQVTSFRMPLYFILSGLFFKQYEGFIGFLKRKTNKLLIPFLFFLLTTSVIPFAIINHDLSLKFFFTKMNGPVYNYAIWFLLCLFEINLLFYLIQWVSNRVSARKQTIIVMSVSSLLGCCGLALGVRQVPNPLYVCTTLTALPFFAFGWWLRRHTRFLSSPVNLIIDLPLIIVCCIIVMTFAFNVIYAYNDIPSEGVWFVYLCGIAGTIMVLTVSKIIRRIPFISFWGRYSIIILCTHQVIVIGLSSALGKYFGGGVSLFATVFLLTMVICHLLILFMRKYMPHVTAQKDVIKVGV
ncbi:MAG: acyltransferase family protein [Muribaculaceae bacterium]|nr:acyltransferase family protein [Muribaculaceae bacterium]